MSFCRRPDGWEREQVWEAPLEARGSRCRKPPRQAVGSVRGELADGSSGRAGVPSPSSSSSFSQRSPPDSGLNKQSAFLPTLEAGPTAAVEADPASGRYLAASPYAHVVGPWARLCPDPLSLGHRSGGIGATLVISFDLIPALEAPSPNRSLPKMYLLKVTRLSTLGFQSNSVTRK